MYNSDILNMRNGKTIELENYGIPLTQSSSNGRAYRISDNSHNVSGINFASTLVQITTEKNHQLGFGDRIILSFLSGFTLQNGTLNMTDFAVQIISATQFELVGSENILGSPNSNEVVEGIVVRVSVGKIDIREVFFNNGKVSFEMEYHHGFAVNNYVDSSLRRHLLAR